MHSFIIFWQLICYCTDVTWIFATSSCCCMVVSCLCCRLVPPHGSTLGQVRGAGLQGRGFREKEGRTWD